MVTAVLSGTEYLKSLSKKADNDIHKSLTVTLEQARNAEVELWLQEYGVSYTGPVSIPLAQIDVKTSQGNQARETALVEDTVARVSAAVKEGQPLPPIVVFAEGTKFTTVDGNNRQAGYKRAGKTVIEAYVISNSTPSETIARMIFNANTRHGVAPDLKQRVRQAAYLMTAHGLSREDAARDAGVLESQVTAYLHVIEANARAKSLNIKGFDVLAEQTRRKLHRGLILDSVFHAASRVVIDTDMSTAVADKFQQQVKCVSSESAMLSVVESWREERELEAKHAKAVGPGRGNRVSSPKQSFVTGVGKIINIDPVQLAQQVLTNEDRDLIIRRISAAINVLAEIESALTSRKL